MIGWTLGAFVLVSLDEYSGLCKGMIKMGRFERAHHSGTLTEAQKDIYQKTSKILAHE